MDPAARMTIGLAAAATVAALAAWIFTCLRNRRRKSPQELERLRRLDLNRRGRIAAGHIVDVLETETASSAARLVLYKYEVGGVAYEAAQDVSPLAAFCLLPAGLAGQTTGVKYDPKRPSNSIIACEEWSGLVTSNRRGVERSRD